MLIWEKSNHMSDNIGCYYADYDEETAMWCVFHTDLKSGHAYSSWADQVSAEEDAAKRNENQKINFENMGLRPGESKIQVYYTPKFKSTQLKKEPDDCVDPC